MHDGGDLGRYRQSAVAHLFAHKLTSPHLMRVVHVGVHCVMPRLTLHFTETVIFGHAPGRRPVRTTPSRRRGLNRQSADSLRYPLTLQGVIPMLRGETCGEHRRANSTILVSNLVPGLDTFGFVS